MNCDQCKGMTFGKCVLCGRVEPDVKRSVGRAYDDYLGVLHSIVGVSKDKQVGGDHYAKHNIQPWDIVEEYGLDYFEGSVLKYLLRRKANRLEDLQKAAHYIEKAIEREAGRGE